MKLLDRKQPCPCGSTTQSGKRPQSVVYGECCARWLEDGLSAPDAQSLMRSRYSAFVLEREAYLLQTWAPAHRPAQVAFDAGVKWLGLEVRAHRRTGEATAEVEFVARQKPLGGPAVRLHERSRFVCVDGQWLYVDGDMLSGAAHEV